VRNSNVDRILPRDAMHKRSLCRHAVSVCVCLSVCLSRSLIVSKRTNISSKKFSPSGSHSSFFPYQTAWQYLDGNPLTGASNAGGIGRNRYSEPIAGFTDMREVPK